MNTKRQINSQKYNIPQIVSEAITAVDSMTLDLSLARQALTNLGHRNPAEELVALYARESAILMTLGKLTGANFSGQVGKISFDNREQAIASLGSYLNRRIQGQHARWTANRR